MPKDGSMSELQKLVNMQQPHDMPDAIKSQQVLCRVSLLIYV